MDMHTAVSLGRATLVIVLTIAIPILGIGLVVGVLVALFQAVTSIQEQTLSMVPKILSTAAALFFLMPWILNQVTDFALSLLHNLARYGGVP